MKFLLTNDDGIDAPGLAALAEAASGLGELIWIAPHTHLSGCGHRVTTDQPIQLMRKDERRWAIDGTPADCVRVALGKLAPDVDWVLSGINHGGNLGADVYHSGTVAAVREAALHGVSAIAFSQYRKRDVEIDWRRASQWARKVLEQLLAKPRLPGAFWNVNFPSLGSQEPEPRVVHCPLEPGPLPLSFRHDDDTMQYNGNYHQRVRGAGSDVDICFTGEIAVSRLTIG